MSEQMKEKLPIIIIVVCALIGIIGYSIEGSEEPIRVLFRAEAGPVVFDHREHKEYDIECEKCHHEIETDEESDGKKKEMNWDCRSCHVKGHEEFDGICEGRIHPQCIGANCIDCHKENEIETDDCTACHMKK